MKHSISRCTGFTVTLAALLIPRIFAQEKPRVAGPAEPSQQVQFDVFLPLQHADELDQLLEEQQTRASANYHKWLTPAEFRSRFGPNPQDIKTVSEMLSAYGFNLVATHSHGVRVQGPIAAVEQAFGVSVSNAVTSTGTVRPVVTEPLNLPPALQRMGAQILQFANLPEAQSQVRQAAGPISPDNRESPFGGYWFDDLKQAYDFPSKLRLDGTGRTIAIMSVSDYLDSDIAEYFAHESKPSAPISPPTIIRFPIFGGTPFNAKSGNSLEVELDLEQAGGIAPGATLVLVNLPDPTDASFADGYLTIVDDNFADIVNSSFTFGSEQLFTAAYNGGIDFFPLLEVFDSIFKQGNAEGITFVESSGDSGGLPTPPLAYFITPPKKPPVVVGKFLPGVDTFNSSPHVTSVGGTNLETTFDPPSLESRYVAENAFADPEIPYDPFGVGNLVAGGVWGSGGGISIFYPKPAYQFFVHTGSSMRGVPDISLQMGGCPAGIAKLPCKKTDSFVWEVLGGHIVGVIGTSIAAPDFAGMLALEEQHLGGSRLGNVNYDIYATAAAQPNAANSPFDLLHQGQPGNNGAFPTTPTGYNFVLGNGTPLVRNFIFAPLVPAAGNPQTPSNP